ncbi:hypothetical protein [Mesorhizobium sangaii]|uniref:HEPN domain-containing protein n=1 Tax=Mesorhizobium sangaii TaxID=505389 RepID=A0A841PE99_9HYPH|nr:hypothetical protein [Mesorhizobium sangaii]MBB6411903.1 hypothetical protein [Mesorhizobium sangaii]
MSERKVYGAGVSPYGIYLLAESYHVSADFLKSASDWHFRFSDHPLRLLYFQALGNYLRSFLRLGGRNPEEIRRYSHNFVAMLNDSTALGLSVGKDVEDFIRSSTKRGDYVQIRYHFVLREGQDRRKQPSIKALENAVSQLEKAVRRAIEATGIEIKPRANSAGSNG